MPGQRQHNCWPTAALNDISAHLSGVAAQGMSANNPRRPHRRRRLSGARRQLLLIAEIRELAAEKGCSGSSELGLPVACVPTEPRR